MRRLAVLLLVAALVVAACGGDGSDAAPPTTVPPTSAPPTTAPPTTAPATTAVPEVSGGRPSPGCDLPAADRASGPEQRSVAWEGRDRRVLVEAPTDADVEVAPPLVLSLHGAGSNAVEQVAYSRLGAAAVARGAVVVTPDGSEPPEGDPYVWNPFPGTEPDDLGFLLAVVDEIGEDRCVDLDRVSAAGLSNGAIMAGVLACHGGGRVGRVVTVAAQVFPVSCPSGPVEVLGMHGTADPTVPFAGGEVGGRPGLELPPVVDAFARWADTGGCAAEPEVSRLADDVERRRWEGCADGVDVELWVVEGGGHTWPGAAIEVEGLGPVTRSFDASGVAVDFLLDGELAAEPIAG